MLKVSLITSVRIIANNIICSGNQRKKKKIQEKTEGEMVTFRFGAVETGEKKNARSNFLF